MGKLRQDWPDSLTILGLSSVLERASAVRALTSRSIHQAGLIGRKCLCLNVGSHRTGIVIAAPVQNRFKLAG